MLTSAQDIEAWLPDSIEKVKAGSMPANRNVDWEDENNVMKETQVRICHAHFERMSDFCGRLASHALTSTFLAAQYDA